MSDDINISNISIEHDHDIIFCTVSKYKLFLSYGKIGMDAYLLYSHLMFTARLQQTNSVRANNIYIRQGLKWTKERLNKSKNLLFDLDLIKQIKRRDEKGRITGWFLEVKTKLSPLEFTTDPENQTVDKPLGGNQTPNALTNKQMLKQKSKCLNENYAFSCQYFQVIDTDMYKYVNTYKNIDIMNEFKKMEIWLDSNPAKRKKNYRKFISGWLGRIKPEEKKDNYEIMENLL